MDFKKTQKAIEKNVATRGATIAGVVMGVMLGRAGYGLTEDLLVTPGGKYNELINYGKRAVMAGAGLVAASAIEGNDTMSEAAKGLGCGFAAIQLVDAVKEVLADNTAVIKLSTGNKLAKAAAKGLGLGCPCNGTAAPMMTLNAYAGRRRNRTTLNIPIFPGRNPYETPGIPRSGDNFFTMAIG